MDALGVQRRDDPAQALVFFQDAQAFQAQQYVAHHGPAHVEVAGQFNLVDAIAAEHRQVHQVALHFVVDHLPAQRLARDIRLAVHAQHGGIQRDAPGRGARGPGHEAAPFKAADHAIGFQLAQGLAHRRAGGAQDLGHMAFQQYRALLQRAFHDGLAQQLDDDGVDRRVPLRFVGFLHECEGGGALVLSRGRRWTRHVVSGSVGGFGWCWVFRQVLRQVLRRMRRSWRRHGAKYRAAHERMNI